MVYTVAVLFSGGKDSLYAVDFALSKGWSVKYLLSIKPTRTDCYLFHFATVEHTPIQARLLGIPHILETCSLSDPIQEAEIIKNIVKKHPVDAVILGGTGLQITQIKSIQDALLPSGIEAFASHAGMDHGKLLCDMIQGGYKIMISQFAAEGLDKTWLGKVLTHESSQELFRLSQKYGFHEGGDGSSYDTYVVDSPLFKNKIDFGMIEKFKETAYSGYVVARHPILLEKSLQQSL